MKKTYKIFSLAIAAILILCLTGCKKNINKGSVNSSDIAEVSMPEYSVSRMEDGKKVVVDEKGNVVENAVITEDGAIEIKDKDTGNIVKTIPKNEVKKYEDVSSEKNNKVENITSSENSSVSETTSSNNSKTNNSSKNNNITTPGQNTKPAKPPTSSNENNQQENNNVSSTPETSKPTDSSNVSSNEPSPPSQSSILSESEIKSAEDYFFNLVNEERARVGVQSLVRDNTLNTAANIRVKETFIRQGHTRPDGTDYYTVLTELKYGTPREDIWSEDGKNWHKDIVYDYGVSGENLSGIGNSDKQEWKKIAELFYNNLRNSSGHYKNMISTNYSKTGIAIHCVYEDNMYKYNIIQIFTEK